MSELSIDFECTFHEPEVASRFAKLFAGWQRESVEGFRLLAADVELDSEHLAAARGGCSMRVLGTSGEASFRAQLQGGDLTTPDVWQVLCAALVDAGAQELVAVGFADRVGSFTVDVLVCGVVEQVLELSRGAQYRRLLEATNPLDLCLQDVREGRIVLPQRSTPNVTISAATPVSDAPSPAPFPLRLMVSREYDYPALYGYIDEAGREVIAPRFSLASDFSEGLADVKGGDSGQFRYIDFMGESAFDMEVNSAAPFSEGLAAVHLLGRGHVLIDRRGTIVFGPSPTVSWTGGAYLHVARDNYKKQLREGRLAFYRTGRSSRVGFVDRTGEVVIEPAFGAVSTFAEGRAIFQNSREAGLIDLSGRKVIKGRFRWLTTFSEGIASAGIAKRAFFYDLSGNLLFENDYYRQFRTFFGRKFRDGLCAVHEAKKGWGFIDRKGALVIDCTFKYVSDFVGGVSVAQYRGVWGRLDARANFTPFQPKLSAQRYELQRTTTGVLGVIDRTMHESYPTGYLALDGSWIWKPRAGMYCRYHIAF